MKLKLFLSLLLIFIVMNLGLGSWGLTESSEARYAEIGREMIVTGDYLNPQLLGIQHFHKPPVTYYLAALGYKIFGLNEYGARFFLAIALVLQLFFIYKIGESVFRDSKRAFAGMLIYFSFPISLIATHNLTTDAFLTTFILWAVYFWLKKKEGKSLWYHHGFYALLGVAFLTKGPVILLPTLVFIICWKLIRKEKFQFNRHHFLGMLLCLGISASWFVAVIASHPELWDYFIQDQIIKRSVDAEKFKRVEPFWYYLLLAPLVGVPWLPFIIAGGIKKRRNFFRPRSAELALLLCIGILFLIFSLFSSKLILYILPIFPFIAILGGSMFYALPPKMLKIFSGIYLALVLILAAGLIYLMLTPEFDIKLVFSVLVLVFLGITVFLSLKFLRENHRMKLLSLGFIFSVGLIFTYHLFAAQNPLPINSVKGVAAFIQKEKPESSRNRVIVYDYLLPSLSFYLNKEILTVHDDNFNTKREVRFEQNDAFRENFINLNHPGDAKRFDHIMSERNNVMVKRKKTVLPDSLQYLLKNFKRVEHIGKWEVYY
ncbi:ArnT family glycosyltransferase [Salegentibacter chungangensis]|uniref:ArnT family glycosyltransferase n=1 Tax=Salegentibacter chungangensis TaxID=1335724 RepID=A0ABW3NR90_9FLAO